MDKNRYDEIARVAYSLYEKRGQGHGNDFADWVEAEKIVMKKYSKGTQSETKNVKPTQQTKAPGKTKSRSATINY